LHFRIFGLVLKIIKNQTESKDSELYTKLPGITGKKTLDSTLKNMPMYSFSKGNIRINHSKSFISKEHNKHIIPLDTPGVGLYNPEKLSILKKLPSIKLGREKRFKSASQLMVFSKNMYFLNLFCIKKTNFLYRIRNVIK